MWKFKILTKDEWQQVQQELVTLRNEVAALRSRSKAYDKDITTLKVVNEHIREKQREHYRRITKLEKKWQSTGK